MRVLVVDDDGDFLHLATRGLQARGHEVETAASAFGLVNKVAATSPGALVLDCEMPGLSGFSALELLAKDRRTSHVPIVLVSHSDGEAQRAALTQHTLATFHRKDGRVRSLIDAVEQHVARVAALDVVKV